MLFTLTRRTHVEPGEWVLVLRGRGRHRLGGHRCGHRPRGAGDRRRLEPREAGGGDGDGGEAVIAYEEEDLKAKAREISGGGVDLVVDPVGGRHSEAALRATRHFGRFCVLGFALGPDRLDPPQPGAAQQPHRRRRGLGGWTFKDPLGNRALIEELMGMVGSGRLHPVRPASYPSRLRPR